MATSRNPSRALSPGPPRRRDAGAGSNGEPPATASDYVTRRIREEILSGNIPLGSRLDQQELAEQMGVSTIPVREGLRRLEASGLVRIHPRRGAFVAELSRTDVTEIKRIREALEELATRLAARNVDERRLARLVELNERMGKLTAKNQAESWGELNRQWHFTLYEAADSPMLMELIATLWDRSSLYRHVYAGTEEHRRQSVREHAQALEHLRHGKPAAAGRVIRNHIFGASARSLVREAGTSESEPR